VTTGIIVGKKGKIAVEGKWAKVIDTPNVVVMLVSDEDGIKRLRHLDTEHLLAKVRSAVDEESCIAFLEECRGT
jgi:hypothetical protein